MKKFKYSLAVFLRKIKLMSLVNSIINFRYKLIEFSYKFFRKNHFEVIYNNDFFDNQVQTDILKDTPKIFVDYIINKFKPDSVVDFGCGTGIYLKEFENRSIEVFGIDGSPAALNNFRLDKSKISIQDITKKIILNRKYSCAICIEVAEHIPKKMSATLVNNLASSSDLVILSAAPKGQGGIGHINEQKKEFWIELFNLEKFDFDLESTEDFKNYLNDRKAIFWLTNNILVFKKR